MLVDASKGIEPDTLETDFCVIGGGAAGIAVALQFAHTPMRVVVLEGDGLTEERVGHGLSRVVYGSSPRLAIDPQRTWYFGRPARTQTFASLAEQSRGDLEFREFLVSFRTKKREDVSRTCPKLAPNSWGQGKTIGVYVETGWSSRPWIPSNGLPQ